MLTPARPQRGFVMIVALVALVVMTLGAFGLLKTVSTSASLAGNLAFEQAASTSADRAVEAAVAWLESNAGQPTSASAATCPTSVGSTVLSCNQASYGYAATRTDPTSTQTWATVWAGLTGAGYTASTSAADNAGNTAAYLIQRMCANQGDVSSANGCNLSPMNLDTASSRKAGNNALAGANQAYYRITVRVAGPRSTVSFVQIMVAI